MSETSAPVYSVDQLLELRYDYDPRNVPMEMRNFKMYLTKCPQLAEQMGLTKQEGDIIRMSDAEVDEDVVILRKLKAVLNKLAERNYASMLAELRKVNRVRSETALEEIIKVLLANIQLSEHYGKLYAELVRDITADGLWTFPTEGDFGPVLVRRCLEQVQDATSGQRQLLAEMQARYGGDPFETELKYKKGVKGLLGFLNCLFQLGLIGPKCVTRTLRSMLPAAGQPIDGYNLEFLLAFCPAIRARLHGLDPTVLPGLRRELQAQLQSSNAPRLKFMLQDVIRFTNGG